jgi:hemerythrin-like domain-containing protein
MKNEGTLSIWALAHENLMHRSNDMKATEVMREEHRVIERVLQCLTAATDQAEDGGTLDGASARKMIDFLRGFADRCHHGKEEAKFFPLARQRGVGCAPGNIDILLDEHEQGRRHVRAMDESLAAAEKGDGQGKARFCQNARAYVRLLTEHIRKEDDCLFPTADMLLTEEDQHTLVRAFEQVEREEMGEGAHERLHALADELCVKWQVPIPAGSAHHGCCGHK